MIVLLVAILPLIVVVSATYPILTLPYAALLVYAVWRKSTEIAEDV